jgi:hypothetical protein
LLGVDTLHPPPHWIVPPHDPHAWPMFVGAPTQLPHIAFSHVWVPPLHAPHACVMPVGHFPAHVAP